VSTLRTRAADVIEPHISGSFKRRERAEGHAMTLDHDGLLGSGLPDAEVQAANNLQCVMSWPEAEKVAAELAAAGLLSNPTEGGAAT
jgi:hypothetical protein